MTVLIATDDGYHVHTPSGEHIHALTGHSVEALTPVGDGTWLAVVDRNEVWRHTLDGSWGPVAASGERLAALAIRDGDFLAGGFGPSVGRVEDDKVATLTDFSAIAGRDDWHGVGSALHVRSMSVTADGRAVLANVHVGGIPRSTDGGTSWQPTIEVEADVHQVLAHPSDPSVVIAAAAVGLCTSADGGATWSVSTDGLHATYCRAVAFAGDDALVSVSDGPFTDRSAIYRSGEGDRLQRLAGRGLPEWFEGNVDTRGLATRGDTVALADHDGNVWVSTGGVGGEWCQLASGLGYVNCVAVA